MACPECGGDIVVKKGRGKRSFYGCSNYPKCNFAVWDKPVAQPCPACGARFMLEKVNKYGTRFLQCREENCKHKEPLPDQLVDDETKKKPARVTA